MRQGEAKGFVSTKNVGPFGWSHTSRRAPERGREAAARLVGLGPLEALLLEALWRHTGPATVRQVQADVPALAYTTVMTTLDRLYRKGVLIRRSSKRAFSYTPRCTRDEMISRQVGELLSASMLSTAVLSTLVRTVAGTDVALLDELEVQVRAERLRLGLLDK